MFEPNGLLIQGLIIFTGLVGQLYVAHQNKTGFYWWMVTNILLLYVTLIHQSWGMFALYIVFAVMCAYSIKKWKDMQSGKPGEYKYLDLSTGHISQATMRWLDEVSFVGLTIAPYDHGAFVSVPTKDTLDEMIESNQIPRDLITVFGYAVRNGFLIIRFDSDGNNSEHLPVFNW